MTDFFKINMHGVLVHIAVCIAASNMTLQTPLLP